MSTRMSWLAECCAGLVDLVLPASCAGCDAVGGPPGLCADCVAALARAVPGRVRPHPEPPGLPRCYALAAYDGALRAALLAYKEQGRRELAASLGDALAGVVAAGLPGPRPVLLVPVPATRAAARRRLGDHMCRLTSRAAVRLRASGWRVGIADALEALPRPDSAHQSAMDRAKTAEAGFVVRVGRLPALARALRAGVAGVLLDDIVTTGATLSVVSRRLSAAGVEVRLAAVLAATQRHRDQGELRSFVPPVPDFRRVTANTSGEEGMTSGLHRVSVRVLR
jgi:predicted amidophosphoribosyltransferase